MIRDLILAAASGQSDYYLTSAYYNSSSSKGAASYSLSSTISAKQTSFSSTTFSLSYSPDGNYLAIAYGAGLVTLVVYARSGSTYTEVGRYEESRLNTNVSYSVKFSNTGSYIALATCYGLNINLDVFTFDGTTLKNVYRNYSDLYFGTDSTGDAVQYVTGLSWAINDTHISINGQNFNGRDTVLTYRSGSKFYSRYPTSPSYLGSIYNTSGFISTAFSPVDTSIAFANDTEIGIYTYTGTTTLTLTKVTSITAPSTLIAGISWSPDGVYLAVAFQTNKTVYVYKRTGNTLALNFTYAANGFGSYSMSTQNVCWSRDGVYLFAGKNIFKKSGTTFVYFKTTGDTTTYANAIY